MSENSADDAPVTTEELIRLIGRCFSTAAAASNRPMDGWTSVEAFARLTGFLVRTNALPGREQVVLDRAVKAMAEGFNQLTADDVFLSEPDEGGQRDQCPDTPEGSTDPDQQRRARDDGGGGHHDADLQQSG